MLKVYSLNQNIVDDCFSDNTVNLANIDGIATLVIEVTQSFNNLQSLNIKFQIFDPDTDRCADVISTTMPRNQLIKSATCLIKFKPRGMLKYTRLHYQVAGKKPTMGKITATVDVID